MQKEVECLEQSAQGETPPPLTPTDPEKEAAPRGWWSGCRRRGQTVSQATSEHSRMLKSHLPEKGPPMCMGLWQPLKESLGGAVGVGGAGTPCSNPLDLGPVTTPHKALCRVSWGQQPQQLLNQQVKVRVYDDPEPGAAPSLGLELFEKETRVSDGWRAKSFYS